ncbi:putative Heterokaryon incompatibility domain-containing protein [Seiridium unicorne]|uniref:Heterokaryon incompatibility domain-containing protein n=1 Tax=Seiridium unicorne TaxID=138068 RepID=A0ABR2V0A0_9PEZI
MACKLTQARLNDFTENIQLNKISKVFVDVIGVVEKLCILYIWIDSLCIIQDSAEDWQAGSAQMGSVYTHSVLNIAATGFPNGQNGLFGKSDSDLLFPIMLTLHQDWYATYEDGFRQLELRKGNYTLIDVNTWKNEVDKSPLCSRGWVAQERTLSVRTLHFGQRQLFWECLCGRRSEVFTEGFVRGTLAKHPKHFLRSRTNEESTKRFQTYPERERRGEKSSVPASFFKPKSYTSSDWQAMLTPQELEGCDLSILDEISSKSWEQYKLQLQKWLVVAEADAQGRVASRVVRSMMLPQRQWVSIVESYSACSLSFSRDKLVAISGLASLISPDMDCQYIAGLWRKDLDHQLLWKVKDAKYEADSEDKSWSFLDLGIGGCHPGKITWLSRINQAHVVLRSSQKFGQVSSGCVTIIGRLGVFRVEASKALKVPPANGKGKLAARKTRIQASWDTLDNRAVFGLSVRTELWRYIEYGTKTITKSKSKARTGQLNVFHLPMRIMDADPDERDWEAPMLTGLLLLPAERDGH